MNARFGAIFIAAVVMSTVCPVNQVKIGHFCRRLSVFYVSNFDLRNLSRKGSFSLRVHLSVILIKFQFHFQDYVAMRFCSNLFCNQKYEFGFEYIVQFTVWIFLYRINRDYYFGLKGDRTIQTSPQQPNREKDSLSKVVFLPISSSIISLQFHVTNIMELGPLLF